MNFIVGISGGVDSSSTASILKDKGSLTACVMLRLTTGDSGCCSLEDSRMARLTAAKLDSRFYYLDSRDSFDKNVIKPYLKSLLAGETPNPCIWCNQKVRFPALLENAINLGADGIATGHYARLDHKFSPKQSFEKAFDQSYVLYNVERNILKKTAFPLGNMSKCEVRGVAKEADLPSHDRKASQDLCFVNKDSLEEFFRSRNLDPSPTVKLFDTAGNFLNTELPLIRITPGMRRGIQISSNRGRLYLLSIDAEKGEAVAGTREEGLTDMVELKDVNFPEIPLSDKIYLARLRYRGNPVPCRIIYSNNGRAVLKMLRPVFAPSPGQHAVLYRGGVVQGGGVISSDAFSEVSLEN